MTTVPPLPEPGLQSDEDRRAISLGFILDAREELEKGSRLQAGEKAWGAVAQYLKIIGEQRGWKHGTHHHLEYIGRQIDMEFNPPGLGFALSEVYNKGHVNFYENQRSFEEVRGVIEEVEEVMPLLESIASQQPRPFTITSNTQRRRLVELTGNTELQVGDYSPVGFSLRHSPESANEGSPPSS